MISFINSWAQGIILAVIIATIIEILLPDGKNKKYVKTIIGIYIMFVILQPLISKISNKKLNIDEIIKNTSSKMDKIETNIGPTIETNSYIEEAYKEKIEESIKKNLKDKGYNINYLSLEIETKDEENYGNIDSVTMQISKIKDRGNDNVKGDISNNIREVETVKVKISNSSNEIKEDNKDDISEEELEMLKEYLNRNYDVSKEKIHIN